jgi:peptidoglycan/xylan/chitin deacetylase (PgdA/CDA1 family)
MVTAGDPAPPAAVHVDLDGARQIFAAHGWRYDAADDPLFASGLEGALAALREARIVATLFVVAEDVEDPAKRSLLRRAVEQGHEIASHSRTHRRLTALARDEKRREIAGSREALRSALGVEVDGFRAPGFRIDRECLELVAEAGYAYDSSLLAGRSSRRALPHRPCAGRTLVELPLPTRAPFRLPFHPSYALVLGDGYFTRGVDGWRARALPFVLLFHLTDFAAPLPRARLGGWRRRLFTLSHLSAADKRARCRAMLRRVSERFEIVPTARLLASAARERDAGAAGKSS